MKNLLHAAIEVSGRWGSTGKRTDATGTFIERRVADSEGI